MTTPLPDVLAAITLGPNDRLVLTFPDRIIDQQHDLIAEQIRAAGLAGRVLVVHSTQPIAIRATKAEGSTVGQCGNVLPPLQIAGREVGTYRYCHLAYGHTGMHSDGKTTWSPPS